MLAKFTVTYAPFTQSMIDDLNLQFENCTFVLAKQIGLSIPPDIIIIVCELLKNIEYSATYDLLKSAFLFVISRIHEIHKNKAPETKITIYCNGEIAEITLPFELTEGQKDRIIDAAIKKFLG